MRDENGNLKVMYHGTPNGDFTVFKDGITINVQSPRSLNFVFGHELAHTMEKAGMALMRAKNQYFCKCVDILSGIMRKIGVEYWNA